MARQKSTSFNFLGKWRDWRWLVFTDRIETLVFQGESNEIGAINLLYRELRKVFEHSSKDVTSKKN